jgi:hypothetical protein
MATQFAKMSRWRGTSVTHRATRRCGLAPRKRPRSRGRARAGARARPQARRDPEAGGRGSPGRRRRREGGDRPGRIGRAHRAHVVKTVMAPARVAARSFPTSSSKSGSSQGTAGEEVA